MKRELFLLVYSLSAFLEACAVVLFFRFARGFRPNQTRFWILTAPTVVIAGLLNVWLFTRL
jgi:hypothetical protein